MKLTVLTSTLARSARIQMQGFTHVELLVSALLGLMIGAICLNLFVSANLLSGKADQVVDGVLEQAGVVTFLSDSLEMAGYVENRTLITDRSILFPQTALFGPGQVVTLTGDDDAQVLRVRFKGPSRHLFRACDGTAIALDVEYTRELRATDAGLICRDLSVAGATLAESLVSSQVELVHFKAIADRPGVADQTIVAKTLLKGAAASLRGVKVAIVFESEKAFFQQSRESEIVFDEFSTFSNDSNRQYKKLELFIQTKNIALTI